MAVTQRGEERKGRVVPDQRSLETADLINVGFF